jgi:hypothetical protein
MTVEEGLEVFNRKSIEIARGLIEAAIRTMREMDGQSQRFDELGPAKFLELSTP